MKRFLVFFIVLIGCSSGASANESPFRKSNFGADFNFIGALVNADSGQPHIAGTLTFAKKKSKVELAFPFFYTQFTYDPAICCEVHIKRIDAQLRMYSRDNQTGLYFGVLARYTDLIGRDWDNNNEQLSFSRRGLGIVVGFKTLVYKNIYWGSNIHYGEFFDEGHLLADGTTDYGIFGPLDYEGDLFMNIELLKIGVRF